MGKRLPHVKVTHDPVDAARGARIRQIRELVGSVGPWAGKSLPQAAFGKQLGVSVRTVRRWEVGKPASAEDLRKMAELAGADVEWILTGRGRPPRPAAARPSQVSEPSPPSGFIRGGGGPLTLADAKAMIAQAIAAALERTLGKDELQDTRAGQLQLAAELKRFADGLRALGCDVSDIYDVVIALKDGTL
jgi:transcriptional regulator with XRE-family HTH domain